MHDNLKSRDLYTLRRERERDRDLEQLLPKELGVFTLQFLNVESFGKLLRKLLFKSANSYETQQATSLDSRLQKNRLKI